MCAAAPAAAGTRNLFGLKQKGTGKKKMGKFKRQKLMPCVPLHFAKTDLVCMAIKSCRHSKLAIIKYEGPSVLGGDVSIVFL